MEISTNITKEQMEFTREQSSYRFPSCLKFEITINDKKHKAALIVETIQLEGGRKLDGSKIDPIDKKFNKIYVENIDPFLVKKIMNFGRINIDDYWYYGGSNNEYEIKDNKIYTQLRFVQCY
jgi:hypothetical protein